MAPSKSGPNGLLKSIAKLNVATLFSGKRPYSLPRTVFVNHPQLPPEYLDSRGRPAPAHVYTPNQMITSKYNFITFIPRNLLEQFRRLANLFFLAIAVIQFIPIFRTIAPAVAILPLVFIVVVTALKDGYEDFKRHQADSRVNQSTVWILAGGEWKNPNASKPKNKTFIRGLLPGRLSRSSKAKKGGSGDQYQLNGVKYDGKVEQDNNERPHWKRTLWEDIRVGDIVKLEDNDFIPADVLICATSEEEDVAFVETKNLDGETNLKSRHAAAALTDLRTAPDCVQAKPFQINCDRPETDMYRLNANIERGGEKMPVDISMTLLRGTALKNTAWVIAVVLFTGLDTKIVQNSGDTPSKRSRVERQMDPQVFINLVILAAVALVCAIIDAVLEQRYAPLNAPWLFGDDAKFDNPRINGLITFFYAILTFQDIIPISLYVSIEVVRTAQAAFIYLDPNIWYQKTDTPTIARTWNLSDDLGQIEYVFSDKTGTLTQNLMVFRQCSIGGKAYRGTNSEITLDVGPNKSPHISIHGEPASAFDLTGKVSKDSSTSTNVLGPGNPSLVSAGEGIEHFHDTEMQEDLERAVTVDETCEFASHARILNGFFTVLALCHSVLTDTDTETGKITYKAQSPDEAALVQAAADVGFVFLGRDKDILTLRTPFSSEEEKYQLLNILEFTSARKRMSVIIRKVTDSPRIFLLSKGADNVIFERLRPEGGHDLRALTDQHLREFASEGLRTLTLAYKVLREDDYVAWNEQYQNANTELDDREAKVEGVCDEIERDLRLLGATAIEDRLQDGVPEAIADLKRAGIKVWVATGDKLETAIAIGRSTNLISSDSNIIIVCASTRRSVQEQMTAALKQYFSNSAHSVPSTPNIPEFDPGRGAPLQRINTGVTDIVGIGNGERAGGFVLVIEGSGLLEAFATEENKDLLLRLGTKCESVICCRVSPLQKALIVKLVKHGLGAMTLAIGDGANDVSMIQAAHVGVGISGEEGLQAVNSSDYAIAQFRFLTRLLFVHGHWSYARNGTMILNFFYKNIVGMGVLFWWQFYNGWSGAYVFDYTYILFWNSLWTILPVFAIGIFDRILDDRILMELPEIYKYGRERYWFNLKQFFIFMIDGIVQTVFIYFLILYTYGSSTTARPDGWNIFLNEFSTPMAFSAVMATNAFAAITSSAWTIWLIFSILFGIVVTWCFTAIYSVYASTTLFGINDFIFPSAYFWLVLPITLTLALAPRAIAKSWKVSFMPDDIDIIRILRRENPNFDLSQAKSGLAVFKRRSISTPRLSTSTVDTRQHQDVRVASRTDMATGLVSEDRGFDFASEEGGVAMRRMQSRLAEHPLQKEGHTRSKSGSKAKALSHMFSLKRLKQK